MLVTSSGTSDSNGKQCASSCLFRHLRMCRYIVLIWSQHGLSEDQIPHTRPASVAGVEQARVGRRCCRKLAVIVVQTTYGCHFFGGLRAVCPCTFNVLAVGICWQNVSGGPAAKECTPTSQRNDALATSAS